LLSTTPQFRGQRRRSTSPSLPNFVPQRASPPAEFNKTNVFLPSIASKEQMNQLARHYGEMIGVKYGEPFLIKELMQVHDVVSMDVRSI
jgi:hypothetical protein